MQQICNLRLKLQSPVSNKFRIKWILSVSKIPKVSFVKSGNSLQNLFVLPSSSWSYYRGSSKCSTFSFVYLIVVRASFVHRLVSQHVPTWWFSSSPISYQQHYVLLLMEEVLHHLGCIKPSEEWEKLPTSTGTGFLNHQQYYYDIEYPLRHQPKHQVVAFTTPWWRTPDGNTAPPKTWHKWRKSWPIFHSESTIFGREILLSPKNLIKISPSKIFNLEWSALMVSDAPCDFFKN